MSLRNMDVQYVGDTLYLPPLERDVKHIIVRGEDAKDWEHFEPVVRCRDCYHYRDISTKHVRSGGIGTCDLGLEWTDLYSIVEPSGFCAWGERVSE